MRKRLGTTSAVALCFSAAILAQSSLVLDQSSPADTTVGTIAIGGAFDQVISQSVTAGMAGRLRAVELPIACDSGSINLQIRDANTDGQPGPTLYYEALYPAASFPSVATGEFVRLRIQREMPVRLSAGQVFTIVLSNSGGSCGLSQGPEGDPYSDGVAWGDSTDGPPVRLGDFGRDDIPFRTFLQ